LTDKADFYYEKDDINNFLDFKKEIIKKAVAYNEYF